MGTRSTIAVLKEDGTVWQVYCHWDGYISHNGEILFNNYKTLKSVEELISNGDMSSLDEKISKTLFYHRDLNEDLNIRKYSNLEMYKMDCQIEECNYIFIDGEWYVFSEDTRPRKMTKLEDYINTNKGK